QPHVVAWESSQPHVEARESSQPHVVARESSQPHVVAWGSSQPHVVARESSQPHVVARESSQPHVVARGSSQPHVEARGSSQPHVVARESSQPHVVAKGFVQLAIAGAVKVLAAATVAIVILAGKPEIKGGGFIQRVDRTTPAAWCDYYGVEVHADVAILFKGVRADYTSPRGTSYKPGTIPEAPDWDGMTRECGGGLHYSPSPGHTKEFIDEKGMRFLACPVALADIVVHPDGQYPRKCKAKKQHVSAWEVDIHGRPVAGAIVTWPPPQGEATAVPKKRKAAGRKRRAA
ncbi:MAG TPA: hypothetical protein VHG72_21605, partial [Polyangia bacterium]|nr:hypothetical protein [Polyangia bacterium]